MKTPGKIHSYTLLLTLVALPASSALAQTQSGLKITGDLAITLRPDPLPSVVKHIDSHTTINANNRADDPFSDFRVRLFLSREWHPKMRMAIELLWDMNARARVNGAYFTFTDFLWNLNAKVGKIPSPFGNYGQRSTYFNANPVIGVPAMWHYKTPLPGNAAIDNAGLIASRSRVNKGVNLAYDACWDTGVELSTLVRGVELTAALTQASLSNPRAYENPGYQIIGKAGIEPVTGLRAGLSAATASWIFPESGVRFPDDIVDYRNTSLGGYLEYQWGRWQWFSEFIDCTWQQPDTFYKVDDLGNQAVNAGVFEGELGAFSAYGELRWNFTPGWYVGGRFDVLQYSEISASNDGLGVKTPWGRDFDRVELALAWRVIREGYIRLDFQSTMFSDAGVDPVNLLALQYFFAF